MLEVSEIREWIIFSLKFMDPSGLSVNVLGICDQFRTPQENFCGPNDNPILCYRIPNVQVGSRFYSHHYKKEMLP